MLETTVSRTFGLSINLYFFNHETVIINTKIEQTINFFIISKLSSKKLFVRLIFFSHEIGKNSKI